MAADMMVPVALVGRRAGRPRTVAALMGIIQLFRSSSGRESETSFCDMTSVAVGVGVLVIPSRMPFIVAIAMAMVMFKKPVCANACRTGFGSAADTVEAAAAAVIVVFPPWLHPAPTSAMNRTILEVVCPLVLVGVVGIVTNASSPSPPLVRKFLAVIFRTPPAIVSSHSTSRAGRLGDIVSFTDDFHFGGWNDRNDAVLVDDDRRTWAVVIDSVRGQLNRGIRSVARYFDAPFAVEVALPAHRGRD
jgi:hypothetical protein